MGLGFPGGTRGEESSCNAGDVGSIPGSGRCPGRGHGNPLQYSCLETPWTACHQKYANTSWIMMMATTCLIFIASWCTEHFPWICSLLILIIIIFYFINKEAEVHGDQAAVSKSISGTSVIQKQVRSTAEVMLPLLCCLYAKKVE